MQHSCSVELPSVRLVTLHRDTISLYFTYFYFLTTACSSSERSIDSSRSAARSSASDPCRNHHARSRPRGHVDDGRLVVWQYVRILHIKRRGHIGPHGFFFGADSGCRDRALSMPRSNTARLATLAALLDPSTHCQPPLTHTSEHWLTSAVSNCLRFSPTIVSGVPLRAFQAFQAFL